MTVKGLVKWLTSRWVAVAICPSTLRGHVDRSLGLADWKAENPYLPKEGLIPTRERTQLSHGRCLPFTVGRFHDHSSSFERQSDYLLGVGEDVVD